MPPVPGTWTLVRQDYGNGAGWAYTYNQFDQVTARWTTDGTAGVKFRNPEDGSMC